MPHGRIAGWFKAPLHFLGSIPVAAVSLVAPPVGQKYVDWRIKTEQADVDGGRDTPEKAKIDLASQTVAVRGVLKLWKLIT
jgi:hypothetical protein